uniref:Uncharacterized protein n=1 Tax=Arundo donax TaxID=35708 RepID=A0A0A9BVG7_ARUDO
MKKNRPVLLQISLVKKLHQALFSLL